MGRPPTRTKRLKDGFYVEVRNKGANAGMKIRSESEMEMNESAAFYIRSGKEVLVLGEHKNDVWLNEAPDSERNLKSKAARRNSKMKKEPIQRVPKAKKEAPVAKVAAKKAAPKKAKAVKKAVPVKKKKKK